MTYAYDRDYLYHAQKNLGHMVDLHYNQNALTRMRNRMGLSQIELSRRSIVKT